MLPEPLDYYDQCWVPWKIKTLSPAIHRYLINRLIVAYRESIRHLSSIATEPISDQLLLELGISIEFLQYCIFHPFHTYQECLWMLFNYTANHTPRYSAIQRLILRIRNGIRPLYVDGPHPSSHSIHELYAILLEFEAFVETYEHDLVQEQFSIIHPEVKDARVRPAVNDNEPIRWAAEHGVSILK